MKSLPFLFVAFLALSCGYCLADESLQPATTDAAPVVKQEAPWKVWPSTPPADCPFPKSDRFSAVAFTGRYWHEGGDGWRLTWTPDGRIFGCWQDGTVNGVHASNKTRTTGFSELTGDHPLNFKAISSTLIPLNPAPHGGQYLCGLIAHDNILYYGTYSLDSYGATWNIMGPLIGFHISRDFGKTWQQVRRPNNPLFGENSIVEGKKGASRWAKVKVGAAYFVDFGKNLQHSPDGKAYLIAQGSVRPEAYNAWASADQAYLLRVKLSPETVNDPKAYEFFAGHKADGQPLWTSDFARIKPLTEWNDHMGTLGLTYIPQLNRYLMTVSDGRGPKRNGSGPYDTYILESDQVTGPWKLVTYMKNFGPQAYFSNFLSQYASGDGHTLWLCYGANWSYVRNADPLKNSPRSSAYGVNLQEVRLLTPAEVTSHRAVPE